MARLWRASLAPFIPRGQQQSSPKPSWMGYWHQGYDVESKFSAEQERRLRSNVRTHSWQWRPLFSLDLGWPSKAHLWRDN